MERIYGVHLGTEKVCVCLYEAGRVEVVCETPACCAFTEMGEVLAGQRAVNARRFHPEREPVAVVPALDEDDWMEGTQILWRGMKFGGEEALACLMKEVRRQMPGVRETEEIPCVVATSAVGYFVQPFIERAFAAAGFAVRRMLRTAVACAVEGYWREMRGGVREESAYCSCWVHEGGFRQVALMDVEDDVLEALFVEQCTDAEVLESIHAAQKRARMSLMSAQAEWEYYYDKEAGARRGREIGDLVRASAKGAAWQAALLAGEDKMKGFLLLDCTTCAYCVEIVEENGAVLLPLKTMIEQNSAIPTRQAVCYERGEGAGRELLRVYVVERYKPMRRIGEFALERYMQKLPRRLEIALAIDAMTAVKIELRDAENGGNVVMLAPGRKSVMRGAGSVFGGAQAEGFFDALSQSAARLKGYGRKRFALGQEKGLWQIAAQCDGFVAQWKQKKDRQDSLWDDAYRLKAEVAEARQREMLEEFIRIVDNLGYALRQGVKPEVGAFRMFVLEEYRGLLEMAETRLGLVAVAAEGAVFDPKVHSATEYEHAEGVEASIVIEERLKGYLWNGTLLRPAMVKVVG